MPDSMPRFDALLFDMDGVLVDTEPLHERAARQVLQAYDLAVPDGLFDRYRGRPDRVLFADRLEDASRSDLSVTALVGEKESAYAQMANRIRPLPGIIGLLDVLRERSLPLACVTSATRADQEVVFATCGFAPYFDAVVTADDVTAPKPAAEPYQRAVDALGVASERCCVIEDAPSGIQSARNAGCTAVGVPTSTDAAMLENAGAAFVADDAAALRTWLMERL